MTTYLHIALLVATVAAASPWCKHVAMALCPVAPGALCLVAPGTLWMLQGHKAPEATGLKCPFALYIQATVPLVLS